MIEKQGTVVEIQGQFAIVQTTPYSGCYQCDAHHGCGMANLTAMLRPKYNEVKVVNQLAAQVGDSVVIGLDEPALLTHSLIFYLLPLIGLFSGAIGYESLVTIQPWAEYEILTITSGLIGLLLGLIIVKRINAKMCNTIRYYPVILKKK